MNTFTKTFAAAAVIAAAVASGAFAQDKDAGPSTGAGMGQMMQGGEDGMQHGDMMGMMPKMMEMMEMMENCNEMMQMMQSMHGEPEKADPKNS